MTSGNSGLLARRMKRELEMLRGGAAPGVSAWLADESRMDRLEGELTGAPETPYAGGAFRLDVHIPSEYPLKPPSVRFVTKIYHPNIDSEGRICLDTLNMPPKGSWKPSLNISTVLTSILALMSTPNPDDGLMPEISDLYRRDRTRYEHNARQWTRRHAMGGAAAADATTDDFVGDTVAKDDEPEPSVAPEQSVQERTPTPPPPPTPPARQTPKARGRGRLARSQPASSEILVADSDDESEEPVSAKKELEPKAAAVEEIIDVDGLSTPPKEEVKQEKKSKVGRLSSSNRKRSTDKGRPRSPTPDVEVVIAEPKLNEPKAEIDDTKPKKGSSSAPGASNSSKRTPDAPAPAPARRNRLKRRRR